MLIFDPCDLLVFLITWYTKGTMMERIKGACVMNFVHLHVHTEYSLLESTATMDALIKKAKDQEMKALAMTDTNVLYGVIPFYKKCVENGIKPLIGMELWIDGILSNDTTFPVLLIAKTENGYKSLLSLSTIKNTSESLSFDQFQQELQDVYVILPFLQSEVSHYLFQGDHSSSSQLLDDWTSISAPLYMEYCPLVPYQKEMEEWIALAEQACIPLVYGNNVQMIRKEDRDTFVALQAIQRNQTFREAKEEVKHPGYFTTQEDVLPFYQDRKEPFINTLSIAEACHVTIPLGETLLPQYPFLEGKKAEEVLREWCERGLKKRYEQINDTILKRLEDELEVICTMGFADYFLIVADIVRYARKQGILVGPGRGSAAGSLVAYVLEITEVDPLHFQLLFERFLNPERISMPDIDLDFPDDRREELMQYVKRTYGEEHVAQIITFGTFGARAALRDMGRIFEAPSPLVNKLVSFFSSQTTIKEVVQKNHDLQSFLSREPLAQRMVDLAMKIEGLPRHSSVHAAGIVMSAQKLTTRVPLIKKGDTVLTLTQFSMESLEDIGLLKIDLLGLRNLSFMERIISSIHRRTNETITPRAIPLNDEKTFELLAKGETTGIFQLESDGMRRALQEISPNQFEDIVAVNALFRPGPSAFIPIYAKRKHGLEEVQYPHEDIASILADTYGVIVYQEQIMQIAAVMAGYSYGEADLLRRAVSKKNRKILEKERTHFVEGALKKGYAEETAHRIYDTIVRFSDYGFNRSHAVAYSMIAYQLAYLKAHFPKDFYASLLTTYQHHPEKLATYIREARKRGITILPPTVNESGPAFLAREEGILFSLLALSSVTMRHMKEIMKERKKGTFKGFIDFLIRMNKGVLERPFLESLIKSGAFDFSGQDRAVLLASIENALEFAEFERDLGGLMTSDETNFRFVEVTPLTESERYSYEKEVAHVYLSGDPLDSYRNVLAPFSPVSFDQPFPTSFFWVVGMVENIKKVRTKNGENMAFVAMTDGVEEIEAVFFPSAYRKWGNQLSNQSAVLVGGKQDRRTERKKILVDEMVLLRDLVEQSQFTLYLKLDHRLERHHLGNKIKQILKRYPGGVKVCLYDEVKKQLFQFHDEYRTSASSHCLKEIQKLLPKDYIAMKKREG